VNAQAILDGAENDGLSLKVEGTNLKVAGPRKILSRWTPELRSHKAELLELLRCASCGVTDTRLIRSYYGDHYCKPCCGVVTAQHDKNGTWPPVPWWSDVDGGAQ
jgi:hypothetical protein